LGACCAVLLAGSVACTLLVDTSEIDQGCGPLQKACDGRCVEISDPTYGCGSSNCDNSDCPSSDRGIVGCVGNSCQIVACLAGFACTDCTVNILTDETNCGSCNALCDSDESCSNGECCTPDGTCRIAAP
jgi:hypothetical protein